MITTVIFDIGNVLMRWNYQRELEKLFGAEVTHRLHEIVDASGLWNEMDRGVLSMEEIRRRSIAAAPDLEREIDIEFDRMGSFAERCDYAIPWIKELRAAGYRVLYLSNYSHDLIDRRPDVLDFITYMDGGIFSCNVLLTKPEPEIYAKLCSTFRLAPEECLFIDDNPANIAAANAFGINSVLFENYEKSYPAVKRFLVEHA